MTEKPPLFVVNGDASAEEVAALTVVLQSLAAAATSGAETKPPVSEWSAPHRLVRSSYPSAPGGWRSSALPR
jgi:hypothetical protein